MKVEELFSRLSFGELSNLSIGNEGAGTIRNEDQSKIISHINEGLLRIYSKFILSEKEVIIELMDHITNYHLIPKYAECTGANVPFRYIKDMPGEPFIDDVIKVLSVFDSRNGYQYPLNDVGNTYSLFTPSPQMLQVPNPKCGVMLAITYQARHPHLDKIGENIVGQNINLPFVLEGALQSFVAYKILSHMNGQEHLVKSQEYLNTFDSITIDVEARDLVNATFATSHTKLENRGFV